ncbi:hypothetical protein N7492_003185 [Penicillium capsulatum]|uniref:Yeast cell wall synthesis Kre9/Knh1-like N-terminal domain-containing protein n=1 Tax=Penicillium capsulatum TaxID=69766 RepID=A0A9W9IK42_9EURO|nr:hypothetical protein N7492_003185 [Penicillium capsulatum]KAJ6122226.1 hypothetical protein N7512_004691 [Penicillium capsulatum]
MHLSLILSLVPLAALVGALKVTEPKEGSVIDASKSLDVKWTSVNTDVSKFNIYLVNNAVYPPVNEKVASGIDASKKSYTIENLDATAGHGYQINLMSDASMNSGILAQSPQFNVTGSASSSRSSSTSTSTSASTSNATAVTSTETTGTLITSVTNKASASGTASVTSGQGRNTSSSATPSPSTGAGASLVASPAVAGFVAGAFALAL